jgi:hypothetical protein
MPFSPGVDIAANPILRVEVRDRVSIGKGHFYGKVRLLLGLLFFFRVVSLCRFNFVSCKSRDDPGV